jgi:magnesium and cobalt exporter, CNNM family
MEPPVDSNPLSGTLILLIISLILLGLFSFLETSITALRLFKLKELEQETKRYKKLFELLEQSPNKILVTILVASSLVNVLTAILSSQIIERFAVWLNLPESIGFALGIIFTTITILIFELIPKNIAKIHGESLFGSTLWITNVLYYTLYPFARSISNISQSLVNWIGTKSPTNLSESISTEKEIQFMLNYLDQKGTVEHQKISMLKNIFQLNTTLIKEVMVPQTEIISIDVNSSTQDILDKFADYQYTRLPVYEKESDNIIGMIHQKDFFQLLTRNPKRSIRDIIRPIIFVPENAKVFGVLKEFREKRMHIAIVLNEFGSVTGLVTLENLIEEIVGDISDEYESIRQKILTLKSGNWLVNGSIELEELSPVLGIGFETEDSITLSGFLTEQFQYVPKPGEQITYRNFQFKIYQASNKRIEQVLISHVAANTLPEI